MGAFLAKPSSMLGIGLVGGVGAAIVLLRCKKAALKDTEESHFTAAEVPPPSDMKMEPVAVEKTKTAPEEEKDAVDQLQDLLPSLLAAAEEMGPKASELKPLLEATISKIPDYKWKIKRYEPMTNILEQLTESGEDKDNNWKKVLQANTADWVFKFEHLHDTSYWDHAEEFAAQELGCGG